MHRKTHKLFFWYCFTFIFVNQTINPFFFMFLQVTNDLLYFSMIKYISFNRFEYIFLFVHDTIQ